MHNPQTADLITEMIPWTTLAWTQVHHGHLPLWNPYSALGMPLAFNWQSATFSVPALVGYLFPLRLAYTVQVLTTLVIAGTGVFVLGRVIGLGVPGCVMAGTGLRTQRSVLRVAGLASRVGDGVGGLAVRRYHPHRSRATSRARAVAFFAVALAFAVYAGQPDAFVLLAVGLTVFMAALLVLRAPWLGGSGPIVRPAVDLVLAVVAGTALGPRSCFRGYSSPPGPSEPQGPGRRRCRYMTSPLPCSRASTGCRWRAATGSVTCSGTPATWSPPPTWV